VKSLSVRLIVAMHKFAPGRDAAFSTSGGILSLQCSNREQALLWSSMFDERPDALGL
jgi:hypothetical protein